MTLSVDTTEDGILIEESDKARIRVDKRNRGVVAYKKESLTDAGDYAEVWSPVDYVSFSNQYYDSDIKEVLKPLIITATNNSHLMERGSVTQEAIKMLNGSDMGDGS